MMRLSEVHDAPNPLATLSASLGAITSLPDEEAAQALNFRFAAWNRLEALREQSFAERGLIIREFEKRRLWAHLISPDTGEPFTSLSAWLSGADYLGCRRTNFEAKRVLALLEDVPPERLVEVPKANLHTLTQLSTTLRNDPDILEAARVLPREEFEKKVEVEHPLQHVEVRTPARFFFNHTQKESVEAWVDYAHHHDIAGSREEAVCWACEQALEDAMNDERLASQEE